jgi:hypothetical protein
MIVRNPLKVSTTDHTIHDIDENLDVRLAKTTLPEYELPAARVIARKALEATRNLARDERASVGTVKKVKNDPRQRDLQWLGRSGSSGH